MLLLKENVDISFEMGRNMKPFRISMADYDYSKELKMSSVRSFLKKKSIHVCRYLGLAHTKIGSLLYNSLLPDGLAGWAHWAPGGIGLSSLEA